MSIIESVSSADFDVSVLQSGTSVLVDFWAPWCAPCRAMMPALEDVAAEYDGAMKIVKVNIDENPEISAQFGIRSIPHLIVFAKGEIVETASGGQTRAALSMMIERALEEGA